MSPSVPLLSPLLVSCGFSYDTAIARMAPPGPRIGSLLLSRYALERSGNGRWRRRTSEGAPASADHPYVLNYLRLYLGRPRRASEGSDQDAARRPWSRSPTTASSWTASPGPITGWASTTGGRLSGEAVSLEPGDSVLNDHLGDIYWKLGRRNEARFQCSGRWPSSPMRPVAPIEAKLQHGLDAKGSGG